MGGGLAIAAACDFRIATPNARFGVPIARTLGNCLSMANYARLTSLVGPQTVKEMLLLAKMVDAQKALQAGLVMEVLPDTAALHARAQQLDRVERDVRLGRLYGRGQRRQGLGRDRLAQARPARTEIDDTAVDERAKFRCVRMAKTNQPHAWNMTRRPRQSSEASARAEPVVPTRAG
jgi:enoyl-CoA hydratase/carnithine racemase